MTFEEVKYIGNVIYSNKKGEEPIIITKEGIFTYLVTQGKNWSYVFVGSKITKKKHVTAKQIEAGIVKAFKKSTKLKPKLWQQLGY